MADEKVNKVGLLLITCNKEGKLVAVLQRRGQYNHEKDWGKESFPGGCQLTAAGRSKVGEGSNEALLREIEEELGSLFLRSIWGSSNLKKISSDDKGENYTLAYFVSHKHLDLIRLHPSTGGLVFVDAERVSKIQSLRDLDKAVGVTDLNVIAMFPDEIEVVRKALAIDWKYEKFSF